MEGISYVGDGVRNWRSAMAHYTYYHYAKQKKKSYCRFVQSFGPFYDWRVNLFAKQELKNLPFIMARGKHAAKFCRQLTPKQEIYDVPDIAIILSSATDEWGKEQLSRWGLSPGQYTILSPSSVIASMPSSVGGSVSSKHTDSFVEIAKALLTQGEHLLFVPHMYSDKKEHCDRKVSREVISKLPAASSVYLVEEDIDPRQAKWLIAHSKQAVVSRYHALVAAISTATPVVAVGWNDYGQCDLAGWDLK